MQTISHCSKGYNQETYNNGEYKGEMVNEYKKGLESINGILVQYMKVYGK